MSTKFDFVPGDKVLFADDFTQDELGEFPARWKLLEGTWEVTSVQRDGEPDPLQVGAQVAFTVNAVAFQPKVVQILDGTS